MEIQTLQATFSAPLLADEIPFFRGAMIKQFDNHILAHNHFVEGGVNYRYPYIQYKNIDGKATVIAIHEGVALLQHKLPRAATELTIGKHKITMKLEQLVIKKNSLHFSEQPIHYRITRWLPLNSKNYKEYTELLALTDKICMLEHILLGNMLSFFKSVEWYVDESIRCVITSIESTKQVTHKDVKMTCLDITFATNVLLPDNIGLGKSVSMGFGTIKKIATINLKK